MKNENDDPWWTGIALCLFLAFFGFCLVIALQLLHEFHKGTTDIKYHPHRCKNPRVRYEAIVWPVRKLGCTLGEYFYEEIGD